jgi:mannan endo-1,4-beta-mannosidase
MFQKPLKRLNFAFIEKIAFAQLIGTWLQNPKIAFVARRGRTESHLQQLIIAYRRTLLVVISWVSAIVLAGLAFLTLTLIANASEPDMMAGSAASVSITGSGFTPSVVTITAGTVVTWTNDTEKPVHLARGDPFRIYLPLILSSTHGISAVATSLPMTGASITQQQDGWGNGDVEIAPQEAYTHIFTTAGKYPYFWKEHPDKTGLVVVQDFTLGITPLMQEAIQGERITYTVAVTALHGFANPVTLAAGAIPAGMAVSWSTNPLTPTANTVLTLTLSISSLIDTYTPVITGTGGGLAHTATTTLLVPSKVLRYLYSISGSKTISGQYNGEPNCDPDKWTTWIYTVTGKYPGLWGGDFLYLYEDVQPDCRWKMIKEAKKQWHNGALVTLSWHVCPPHYEEHCDWEKGIMSDLTNEEWDELVKEGQPMNNKWKERIDTIVPYLRDLQYNGVEVLWRPLHEINAEWCWWCGRPDHSPKLYQITHDYMTHEKGLKNLIWVWNVKDLTPTTTISSTTLEFTKYYPGDNYVDVVSLDPWNHGFTQEIYSATLAVANGKPIGIGETGKLPPCNVLSAQPRWVWFLGWAEQVKASNTITEVREVYNCPRVITIAPEIQVLDGTTNITNNTGSVDFGTTSVGAPLTKTFTVSNTGTTVMASNTGPSVLTMSTLSVPTGFSITGDFDSSRVTLGNITSFTITLVATTTGAFSGTLSFNNNDWDENPFNFVISGMVN